MDQQPWVLLGVSLLGLLLHGGFSRLLPGPLGVVSASPRHGREMQIPVTTVGDSDLGTLLPCKEENVISSPRRPEVGQGRHVPLGAACVQRGPEEPGVDEDALQILDLPFCHSHSCTCHLSMSPILGPRPWGAWNPSGLCQGFLNQTQLLGTLLQSCPPGSCVCVCPSPRAGGLPRSPTTLKEQWGTAGHWGVCAHSGPRLAPS